MTNLTDTPDYTRRFWAKAVPYRQKGPAQIHLLEHHLADVGACFEALLQQPTLRRRLAYAGGRENLDLDDAMAARLAVFAALHDIGKVNVGFQTQIWQDTDFPGGRRLTRAGHYHELAPVMNREDNVASDWFFDSLGWWYDATETWDDQGGITVCDLFVAALSHHGQPMQMEGKARCNPQLWRTYGGLNPEECVRRIGQLVRQWFPAAWDATAPRLPATAAFQHLFLGLCILADWIGSNEVWFPFCQEPDDNYINTARQRARLAVKAIGLDLAEQRAAFSSLPEFRSLFGFDANAIQQAARDTPLEEPLVIIESETGSGKTEAALARFARMYAEGLVDGLYFALPTRAAASQIHDRVKRFTSQLLPRESQMKPILAVPGYIRGGDVTGERLQDYDVWWDDHADGTTRERPWASESPKRYLAAQIAVGTVDQALLAALKVRHAHLRAACLSRNLLVVDEVHASDAYMRQVLRALLDAHLGAGGYALLMSDTLGSAARHQWLSAGRRPATEPPALDAAQAAPYPSVSFRKAGEHATRAAGENDQKKTVNIKTLPLMDDFGGIADRALTAARAGAKVLIIRNTVAYAVETQQALERAAATADQPLLFAVKGIAALHHGRFAATDRRALDSEVEARLGRERPAGGVIIVGTQTLEQSLDIDADLLITDLCPVDVLLQRIGRLHRHSKSQRPAAGAKPVCQVLTPGDDLSPLLRQSVNGLGQYVYRDLRILEATRRLIEEYPEWRIPEMNRELVERATHPTVLESIAQEKREDWIEHGLKVDGEDLANVQTGGGSVIRRDKSFYRDNDYILFNSSEENIRTRLGDESIDVSLAPPAPSPLGQEASIERIALPYRWLRGAQITEESAPPAIADGGFTFTFAGRTFRYDRFGLHPER